MNRILLLSVAVCLFLGFVSCKPKQSAYRAAYEQAKERDLDEDEPVDIVVLDGEEEDVDGPSEVVVPVSKPRETYQPTTPVAQPYETTRQERINPFMGESGSGLRRYSVVVGSFRNQTNAYSLRDRMQRDGYHPILGENPSGMIRVIVTSFDSKSEALNSRESIRRRYYPNFQDAWILERYY